MKRLYLILSMLILAGAASDAQPAKGRRYTFDQNWQFRLLNDTTDRDLRQVSIPHDWSIEMPFKPEEGGSAGYLPGGLGLYTKDFTIPASLAAAESLTIIFDGVYHRATVTLNGVKLGYHVYGYTGFAFDITPYVNRKGSNHIEVQVDREDKSRWYTGSGIYRHVWLQATGSTHVRYNGIHVMPSTDGNVVVKADVVGGDTYSVINTIYDATGRKVAQAKGYSLHVSHPTLWSIDSPVLYTLLTKVIDANGRQTDEVETLFGFRDIRFDSNTGFWLNGTNMKLKGVCLHQDVGSLGVAVPDEVWLRRLKALKDIGCNAIRCSHNPPAPEFLDICDSLGLLVIDEAFDKWKSGYYAQYFDQCARQDITDMVERDRNHPCIILWSIGNELQEAWDNKAAANANADAAASVDNKADISTAVSSDGDTEGIRRARMLNGIVKYLDPSRPTMVACQQGFNDMFGNVTDVVGYNYLEPRMLADHKAHPDRKMLVTEAFPYYSGMRIDNVRDFVERNPWNFVEQNPFIAGSFVWAGVDYLGESAPWPAKGWCSCPFDMTLKERPQAAFYHPAWNPDKDYLKLMVRDNCFDQPAGKDHWQYPAMADTWDLPYGDGRCVQLRCYTTCDSVQVFIPKWNNPHMPLKTRITNDYPDHCITLQIPAQKGSVLAVGYKDGREVLRDSLVSHGKVADVRLVVDHPTLSPVATDFTSLHPTSITQHPTPITHTAHIRLTLVDKDGLIQQMEPRTFRVETEGPIRLLGVETGDMRRNYSWRTTELPTYFGEGLIRLQATTQPGVARIKVYVEGFDKPFVQTITIK